MPLHDKAAAAAAVNGGGGEEDDGGTDADGVRKGSTTAAMQSHYMAVMRRRATQTAVLAVAGIVAMVVANEVAWSWNTTAGLSSRFCADARDYACDPRDGATMFPITSPLLALNIIRVLGMTATTVAALVTLTGYHAAQVEYRKLKNQLPSGATLGNAAGVRTRYLLEAAALAVHVFPFIEDVATGPALYLAMSQLMFLRWFFLVRVVIHNSSLSGSNGRFISALTNVEFSSSFVLKTVLKDRSLVFVTVVLAILLFSTSYATRMIESAMCAWDRSLGCMPVSFEDAAWLMVVTMLTIGYGDITVKTGAARFIVIAGGICGTVVLAAAIALVAESLQLSRSEAKVLTFLRKHDYRRRVTNSAALCIQSAYRLHRIRNGGFLHDVEDDARRALAAEAREALRQRGSRAGGGAVTIDTAIVPASGTALHARHGCVWWNPATWCCRGSGDNGGASSAAVVPISGPETPGGDGVAAGSSSGAPLLTAPPRASRRNGCGRCCSRSVAPAEATAAGAAAPRSGSGREGKPAISTTQVALFEHALFQHVEAFRTVKRYVLSHDPTDATDRQLTLLETLEVNVDEIRSNVETLSEFLLGAGAALAAGGGGGGGEGDGDEGGGTGRGSHDGGGGDGGGAAGATGLAAVLTPAAQEHLGKIAAEKSGRLATAASRAILAAVTPKAAPKEDGGDTGFFRRGARRGGGGGGGGGGDADGERAAPGGSISGSGDGNSKHGLSLDMRRAGSRLRLALAHAGSAGDVTAPPHPPVVGADAAAPPGMDELRATCRALAADLAAAVSALSATQAAFAEYRAVTDARLARLEGGSGSRVPALPRIGSGIASGGGGGGSTGGGGGASSSSGASGGGGDGVTIGVVSTTAVAAGHTSSAARLPRLVPYSSAGGGGGGSGGGSGDALTAPPAAPVHPPTPSSAAAYTALSAVLDGGGAVEPPGS